LTRISSSSEVRYSRNDLTNASSDVEPCSISNLSRLSVNSGLIKFPRTLSNEHKLFVTVCGDIRPNGALNGVGHYRRCCRANDKATPISILAPAMKLTLRHEWRPRPLRSFISLLDLKTGKPAGLGVALSAAHFSQESNWPFTLR
jgi:hypothetical protein